jgi:hypothetical protein
MPGRLGNAYRLSALIELRVARIYRKLSERFSDQPAVRDFFRTLQAEEEEHASLMLLCLYTIDSSADQGFVPCVSDPDIRATLAELRVIDHNLGQLGLDQALHLTERLERSEINVIFEKLLSQASSPRNALFIDQLHQAEGHATAVPKRIRALRDRLRSGSAASPSTDP